MLLAGIRPTVADRLPGSPVVEADFRLLEILELLQLLFPLLERVSQVRLEVFQGLEALILKLLVSEVLEQFCVLTRLLLLVDIREVDSIEFAHPFEIAVPSAVHEGVRVAHVEAEHQTERGVLVLRDVDVPEG